MSAAHSKCPDCGKRQELRHEAGIWRIAMHRLATGKFCVGSNVAVPAPVTEPERSAR